MTVATHSACPATNGDKMTTSRSTNAALQEERPLSLADFIKRGLLAGGLAGAASALYLVLVVEGPIDEALAIEAARHGDDGHGHDHELFSRTTQIIGGMTAGLIYGLVAGLIFSVVFVRLRHRLPGGDDFGRSLRLAAMGFLTIVVIPGLKYPANLPGVGDPETVNDRTVAYLTLMAMGIVLVMLAWNGVHALQRRGVDEHRARAVGVVFLTVGVAVAWALWSEAEATPADIPADLLWRFRIFSIGGLALQWSLIGLVFGLAASGVPGRTALTES